MGRTTRRDRVLSSEGPVTSVVAHDDRATGATYQQTRKRRAHRLNRALSLQPCLHSSTDKVASHTQEKLSEVSG
jgi:hypothetical protein